MAKSVQIIIEAASGATQFLHSALDKTVPGMVVKAGMFPQNVY